MPNQSILDTIRTGKVSVRRGALSGQIARDGIRLNFAEFEAGDRNTPIYNFMNAMDESRGYMRPAQFAVRLNPPNQIDRTRSSPSFKERLGQIATSPTPNQALTSTIQSGISELTGGLFGAQEKDIRVLELNCSEAVLPSETFVFADHRHSGITYEMPIQRAYANEITLSFYVSADMYEKYFFEEWQSKIIPKNRHAVRYRTDYSTDIEILTLTRDAGAWMARSRGQTGGSGDINEEVSYTLNLKNAYPKTIGEVQLGYDQSDTIGTINVTFSFTKSISGIKDISNEQEDSLYSSAVDAVSSTFDGFF